MNILLPHVKLRQHKIIARFHTLIYAMGVATTLSPHLKYIFPPMYSTTLCYTANFSFFDTDTVSVTDSTTNFYVWLSKRNRKSFIIILF